MAFTVPNFNLDVYIWRWQATVPPSGSPIITTKGNLSSGYRRTLGWNQEQPANTTSFGGYQWMTFLLLPKGTDVQPGWLQAGNPTHSDIIQLPTYGARFWYVVGWTDVARGFSNEYREVGIFPLLPWSPPLP